MVIIFMLFILLNPIDFIARFDFENIALQYLCGSFRAICMFLILGRL